MTGSAMQYLEIIGSYLPGLPVESAWQLLQEIDSLYLAVAGEQGYLRDTSWAALVSISMSGWSFLRFGKI